MGKPVPSEVVGHPDLTHQRDKPYKRQPHHSEVVSFDASNDRSAESLNSVSACLIHRLASSDVGADLGAAQTAKRHPDFLDTRHHFPPVSHGHRRHDDVGAAAQHSQHPRCIG